MEPIAIDDILHILPHRYPFIMVDRILEIDLEGRRIVGLKNVSANEPQFQGHFPGLPVMPGVLQIEAMAQAGGILLLKLLGKTDLVPYFMTIDKVKFRRVVKPGDQLRLEMDVISLRSRAARMRGVALVDGAVATEAEMACVLAEREG
jgi:beta-hydroxyacyl-ACP dehydratase FabZ